MREIIFGEAYIIPWVLWKWNEFTSKEYFTKFKSCFHNFLTDLCTNSHTLCCFSTLRGCFSYAWWSMRVFLCSRDFCTFFRTKSPATLIEKHFLLKVVTALSQTSGIPAVPKHLKLQGAACSHHRNFNRATTSWYFRGGNECNFLLYGGETIITCCIKHLNMFLF